MTWFRAELVGGPKDGTIVWLKPGTVTFEVPLENLGPALFAETDPPLAPRRAIYRRRCGPDRHTVPFDYEIVRR